MKQLALALALAGSGCAHKPVTNQQVAIAALYGGMFAALLVVTVKYCNTGCTWQ